MRSVDDGEWEQSDNDQSSYSEDSGSGRRDKVRWLISRNISFGKQQHNTHALQQSLWCPDAVFEQCKGRLNSDSSYINSKLEKSLKRFGNS